MVQNIGNPASGYALVISKDAFRGTFAIGKDETIKDNEKEIGNAFKMFCSEMDSILSKRYPSNWLGCSTCLTPEEVRLEMKRLYPYGDNPERNVYCEAIRTVAATLNFRITV